MFKSFLTSFFVTSIFLFWIVTVSAQVMESSNYRIQSDSVNLGGVQSSSSSYVLEDTVGEVGTGESTSASYNLKAGYQQMQEVFLSLSAAADVTLSPSIGGITGGTANGSTSATVITDGAAGYQLSIKASSSPALTSGPDSFSDYVPAGSNPDFTFSIPATTSAFAFSPEGVDIVQRYQDNGASCNVGSADANDSCWDGLSTTNTVISERTSSNHPSGTQTTIEFRAQSGAQHNQLNGT